MRERAFQRGLNVNGVFYDQWELGRWSGGGDRRVGNLKRLEREKTCSLQGPEAHLNYWSTLKILHFALPQDLGQVGSSFSFLWSLS